MLTDRDGPLLLALHRLNLAHARAVGGRRARKELDQPTDPLGRMQQLRLGLGLGLD